MEFHMSLELNDSYNVIQKKIAQDSSVYCSQDLEERVEHVNATERLETSDSYSKFIIGVMGRQLKSFLDCTDNLKCVHYKNYSSWIQEN